MTTYWLEGERKGIHNQYKPLGEMDRLSSINLSTSSEQNKQINSNPPDYLDYSFGGKGQQQQQLQQSQPMASIDAS